MKASNNKMFVLATIFSFSVAGTWVASAQPAGTQKTPTATPTPTPTGTPTSGGKSTTKAVGCLNGQAYPCASQPNHQPTTGSNVGRNANTNPK